MEEIETEHYLRYMVPDVPGMVGKIATALGNHGVSISQVIQKERNEGGERVPVVLLTHKTKERCLKAALKEIYSLGSVLDELPQVIRIERFVS
jgi:homoserine dehydrogenase